MKAPPRRGYADQARSLKLSKALRASALTGSAVVFIRYTLAPPRVRPDVY